MLRGRGFSMRAMLIAAGFRQNKVQEHLIRIASSLAANAKNDLLPVSPLSASRSLSISAMMSFSSSLCVVRTRRLKPTPLGTPDPIAG